MEHGQSADTAVETPIWFGEIAPAETKLPSFDDLKSYLQALSFVALAILLRALVGGVAPGIAYFVLLLPAVVFAGAFYGTRQGACAALAGSIAFAALFQGMAFFEPPHPNRQQIDLVLFLMASASVLWATHRMRSEAAAAAAAQARLEEVFRQMPCAASILEAPHGEVLLRSDRITDILGPIEGPIHAKNSVESHAMHLDGRRYETEDYPIVRAMTRGEVIEAEPMLYSHPSGRLVDLEVYARPVRVGGRIKGAVGMAFDVSQRRAAERRLAAQDATSRAMTERLAAALDAGKLGTWELDLTTNMLTFDGRAAAMIGLPEEPVTMARPEAARFFDSDDYATYLGIFREALAAKGTYNVTLRGRSPEGSPRWYVKRGAVLDGDAKAVGVLHDITREKEREIELQQALDARDLLMREADHRIKNSLQLVASLLRMQAKRAENEDARVALKSAETRIDAIAEAHVAFQESQTFESVAAGTMIRELCQRLAQLDPAITIRHEIEGCFALQADLAIPLGLIISEVVTNALRHAFTPGESGTIRVTARRESDAIHVEAADDGRGFAQDEQPRQGLGTAIIKTLCATLNAEATTRSAPGEGTRVTIRVPLAA